MSEPKVVEVQRLTWPVYMQLERQMPAPIAKDEVQAAFNLGVQHVLAALRKGIVVG